MAWDPKEEGSWAWLTKTAWEHGGVKEFMEDIKSEGDLKLIGGIIIGIAAASLFHKCVTMIKSKKKEDIVYEDDDTFYKDIDDETDIIYDL